MLYEKALKKISDAGGLVIDVGGGMHIERTNRLYNKTANENLLDLSKIQYRVLDKTDTYNPHFVADIRKMPFEDGAVDSFIVWRVIEHVETPHEAIAEVRRCLKHGGIAYFQFMFLNGYGGFPGYYQDFYRFTEDGIRYLLKDFSSVEIEPIMGPIRTWVRLGLPTIEKRYGKIFDWMDRKRGMGKNVFGYDVLAII
jgi:ubiquinone/menaquinone biosynthesis C-methylase UbiE